MTPERFVAVTATWIDPETLWGMYFTPATPRPENIEVIRNQQQSGGMVNPYAAIMRNRVSDSQRKTPVSFEGEPEQASASS